MAIDVNLERLVTLAEYRRLRPPGRDGKPMLPATASRHAGLGVRGVRLETVRFGGTLYTSREAIQRLVDALDAARFGRAGAQAARPAAPVSASKAAEIFK